MVFLYRLLFFNICTFFTIPLLPEMIILGIVYWKSYHKIKKKKLTMFAYSLLGSFAYPFCLYLLVYFTSGGMKNGSAEIFVLVIFGLPVIFLVFIIEFFIMSLMKRRN